MKRIGAKLLVAVFAGLTGFASPAAAAEGAFCGGLAGVRCDAGEICVPSDGMCPRTVRDGSGTCRKPVADCPSGKSAPVCGCDGRTYESACEAIKARTSVQSAGRC